jgi:outer membrane protein OmpA-like peptidoglycan-associated protein
MGPGAEALDCDCSHFPWQPQECVEYCGTLLLRAASDADIELLFEDTPNFAAALAAARRDVSPVTFSGVQALMEGTAGAEFAGKVMRAAQAVVGRSWEEIEQGGDLRIVRGGNGGAVVAEAVQIVEVPQTRQDALERAIAAGKVSEGKVVLETVTSESIHFSFDGEGLSSEAMASLAELASWLHSLNSTVWVEIQGHSDNSGPEEYNLERAGARAEAVRRYLAVHEAVPLEWMSVFSYGESIPIADNITREGRAQNRRVTLVVIQ